MRRIKQPAVVYLVFCLAGFFLQQFAAAAEYTVGGPAGANNYATLDALFTAILTFSDQDVITLYQDDDSLNNFLKPHTINLSGNKAITIRSNDGTPRIISMKDPSSPPNHGGMIILSGNGVLALDGVTLTGGHADASGGAIASLLNSAALTFVGSGSYTFSGNTADTGNGGVISVGGALTFTGNGNYTFSKNQSGFIGGAISTSDAPLIFSGSGNYVFLENKTGQSGGAVATEGKSKAPITFSGDGNYTFTGNQANGTYSEGGAIYADTSLEFTGGGTYTFSDNFATSMGGAVGVDGQFVFSGDGNYVFTGNRASNPLPNYGYGGAIYAGQFLVFSGNGNYTFIGNQADLNGGAIWVWNQYLTFSEYGNYTFTGNEANNGGAISTYSTGSGNRTTFSGNGNYLFSGNKARVNGGAIHIRHALAFSNNGVYEFSGNTADSNGGAIYAYNTLDFSGNGIYKFTGNTADNNGGAIYAVYALNYSGNGIYEFTGNTAGNNGGVIYADRALTFSGAGSNYTFTGNQAGRGGAVFAAGGLDIQRGMTFTDNHATTTTADMSLGLGGAIYSNGSNVTIRALDITDMSVMFSGNTMNPGNTGTIPNSIYFGNTNPISDRVSTVTFDVAQNAKFWMFDPMASQEDGLLSRNLTVNLTKEGLGTWVLAGHNDMRSATVWSIDEGKLFMIHDYDNKTSADTFTHINLSHDTNAAFTLKSGAGLIVDPGLNNPHFITGKNITLEAGSTSDAQGFRYGPILPLGRHVLLTLDEQNGTLDNKQAVVQKTNGIVTVGAYDYNYELLQWERDMHDLVFNITDKTLNPDNSGSPSLTAPGVVAFYNPAVNIIRQHGRDVLGLCRQIRHRDCYNNALWATPFYVNAKQSKRIGTDDVGYNLDFPGLTIGYDHRWYRKFAGISASIGTPEFSAAHTHIKGDDATILAYGGVKLPQSFALTGHIGGEHTRFNQFRQVEDESYASRFSSRSFLVGTELSRTRLLGRYSNFCVRTAIGYDLIAQWSKGFYETEGEDMFLGLSLDVPSSKRFLHRLKVGMDLNWQPNQRFIATGECYYLSVWDAHPPVTANFINDHYNTFSTWGNAVDADHLGLGARMTFLTKKNWEFSTSYTAFLGYNTTGQQALLTAVCKF